MFMRIMVPNGIRSQSRSFSVDYCLYGSRIDGAGGCIEAQVIQFAGFSHPALSACLDEISSAIDHRCAAKSNFAGHVGQVCLLLQIERFDM